MEKLIKEIYFLCKNILSKYKKELIDLDYVNKTEDEIKINFRLWDNKGNLKLFLKLEYNIHYKKLNVFAFNDRIYSGSEIKTISDTKNIINRLKLFYECVRDKI